MLTFLFIDCFLSVSIALLNSIVMPFIDFKTSSEFVNYIPPFGGRIVPHCIVTGRNGYGLNSGPC